MPKSRLFFGGVLLLTILLVVSGSLFAMRPPVANEDGRIVRQMHYPLEGIGGNPTRDADDLYTLRWQYSTDGGATWEENGEIYNAGDAGMWTLDNRGRTVSNWSKDPNHAGLMGVVADGNNNLHFLVVLNAFDTTAALNPLHRVNGLYDVRCSADGASVSYILVKEQQANHNFRWADAGMDADGAIYTLWVDQQDTIVNFRAAKTTDDGDHWTAGFQVLNNLVIGEGADDQMPYPHMTYNIGPDFFYVIYQVKTEEGWAHNILKVPSSLSGNVEAMNTPAVSGTYLNYWYSCVKPIAFDPDSNFVMFVYRNGADGNTGIGNLGADNSWSVSSLIGAQRYPSCGLNRHDAIPWIFSNNGVDIDSGGYHRNWYAFDDFGYGGGDWQGPIVQDSIFYDGTRDLLYCHNGVWATGGNLVSGSSIWGSLEPEGYQVNFSSDGGANWHAPHNMFSIFDENDPLLGGTVPMPQLVAGADNYVFVAYRGKYGVTDIIPPAVGHIENLSSYMLDQPWTCECNLFDAGGIQSTTINWWVNPVPAAEVVWWAQDSSHADENGNGRYFYHMPSDSMNGLRLAAGDTVNFYVDANDNTGNYTAGYTNMLIVNQGWLGVWQKIEVPQESQLGQNYPNPFNNTTVIPFALRHTGNVKLQVWDVNGRLVSTLVNGRNVAGNHNVSWNTEGVTSGIYIYTLETADGRLSNKMTLLH